MAYDTLVDGAKLEEGLTKVANKIRRLTDCEDALSFPDQFSYELGYISRSEVINSRAIRRISSDFSGLYDYGCDCALYWSINFVSDSGSIDISGVGRNVGSTALRYIYVLTDVGVVLRCYINRSTEEIYLETIITSSNGDEWGTEARTYMTMPTEWLLDAGFWVVAAGERVLVLEVYEF